MIKSLKWILFIFGTILSVSFLSSFSLCEGEFEKELLKQKEEAEANNKNPLYNTKYWIIGGILLGASIAVLLYFFPDRLFPDPSSTGASGASGASGSSGSITSNRTASIPPSSASGITSNRVASIPSRIGVLSQVTPEIFKQAVYYDINACVKYSVLTAVALKTAYKNFPSLNPVLTSSRYGDNIRDISAVKYPDLTFIMPLQEKIQSLLPPEAPVCENFQQLTNLIQNSGIALDDIPLYVLLLLYKTTVAFKTLGYSNLLSAYIFESCKYMSLYKKIYGLGRVVPEDIHSILTLIDLDPSNVLAILKFILNTAHVLPNYRAFIEIFQRDKLDEFVVTKYPGDPTDVPWYTSRLSPDISSLFRRLEDKGIPMHHVDMNIFFYHNYLCVLWKRYMTNRDYIEDY